MMTVTVMLSAGLRAYAPDYRPAEGLSLELGQGLSAAALAEKIGLPEAEIKIVMINGRRAALDRILADGDRVGFFPAIAGG